MRCNDPELRYLKLTPAGAEYVDQISAQESDRNTRSAFRDLVLGIAPPGARLFDFGAGPGLDARFFAERGFAVDAFDVDPRMREYFSAHCRDLIDSGRIALDACTYREFLTRTGPDTIRRADLVISNFAPLNLVENLPELFAKFHSLTGPQGKILANVLNPFYLGDMRSRYWWRGAPRLWRDGALFLPGPQAPYYRRLLRNFRALSAPYFSLRRVFQGMPPAPGGDRFAWLRMATCRYMFLLFEKTDLA
jgi:SAM-dependent methyltransferase